MGKIKINKEIFSFLILVTTILFICLPQVASAAVELTLVSGPTTWSIAARPGTWTQTSSSNWTIQGSTSGTTEDIDFRATTTTWWAAANIEADGYGTAGVNRFVLRLNDVSGTLITGTDTECKSNLAPSTNWSFGLYFASPTTGTADVTGKAITVTITARTAS